MAVTSAAELSIPKSIHLRPDEKPSQELGRDSFMKLLVAELKNQDPLDPLKAREMITQLSELTSVDKLIGIEEGIAGVQAETAALASSNVTSMVGRTVSADVATISLQANGMTEGIFQVPSRAKEVEVTLRNAEGDAVRTLEFGDTFPGSHTFAWDGNDQTGGRLPPGRYSVEVTAKSAAGNPIPATTQVTGMVTEISYENGLPEAVIGNSRVRLGDIKSVAQ